MNSKQTLNYSYFDLDIISKFESFEEFPNTKPVLLANRSGLILYANNSARIKHNFKEGKNLFDVYSEPNLHSLFSNLIQNSISSFCTDLIFKDDDNFYKGYLLNIEKVVIQNEELFIILIDSQNSRTKLTQKVNTYNQALESVNVGVMLADKDAHINYLSTSFEKFLHMKLEEVYNKNLADTFKNYLSKNEFDELKYSIRLHKNWVKVISDFSADGDILYKEIRLSAVQDNIDNSINFIIIANDITEHIKQERLLIKSEKRQKLIINNISDPILILKKEKQKLVIENANESFYKNILSVKQSANSDKNLNYLIAPELLKSIENSINHLNEQHRIHAQFHYTAPNNIRYLGKITFTDDNEDLTRLFIINMTDITDQLEIERKLREAYKKEISLNRLKSTFLANMSHEIRTPLNAIVGYSELLEDDVKAMNYESSSQMTIYLKDGVNRLLKLVDNIVELSLLESGNEEIHLKELDLNAIINVNKEIWREQCIGKELKIYYKLSGLKIIVKANEEKLNRALKEIVDNSIKYSLSNGDILITTSENEENGIIEVVDQGIGIEKSSMEKIFQLFEQVEEVGYTRKYEGAGLGLSLANKLVAHMNGNIKINSKPNEGTTITIILPKE